jgi:arylsulfatase A-like enzyme
MSPAKRRVGSRRSASPASAGLFWLLAGSLLGACAEPKEPAARPPNVVLVLVDTLRADRLPFHGGPPETAPFLARLAERSVVFENAWSPSSWTLPATVSILTSVHPFQHGVTDLVGLEPEPGDEPQPVNCIPPQIETLAEVLAAHGYSTYGIASNLLVGEAVGFDRGFDRFVQLADEPADRVNAQVDSWLEEMRKSEPFFLYLHYFDPHDTFHTREPWFDPPASAKPRGWPDISRPSRDDHFHGDIDWILTRVGSLPADLRGKRAVDMTTEELDRLLEWMRAAYDSEIGYVDDRIGRLFDELGLEDAVVVFLSDHGEEFYEHGDLTHGQNLYAETVRVPLLVHLPGGIRAGRVRAPVSTLDVVPTLRRLLGLPPADQDQGLDLFAASAGRAVHGILEGKSGQHPLEDDMRSIVVNDRRLIEWSGGRVELFDVADDPWERDDLASALPAAVSELRRQLAVMESSAPRFPRTRCDPPPIDDALRDRLKAIGYLGEGSD